ncbi:MAG: prepilin-type N-terminal cleavage/methylation domain-containing protein [Desulfuromonadaceae bacterium]
MVNTLKLSIFIDNACYKSRRRLVRRFRQSTVSGCYGFTLVELILVVAIIGALAIIALPAFNSYIKSTKTVASASDLRTIDKAITAYFFEVNALPASLNVVGMASLVDPWKRPYVYQIITGGYDELVDIAGVSLNADYDLYSMGQDGVSAPIPSIVTADDVARSNNGSYVGVR